MSSYLSQAYEIQQPQSSIDVAVIDNVLTTLTGQYNANKAKIDQTLASYNNSLKGLRDSDNEYIVNRIKEADSIMTAYKKKNGNLAYNSTTDTILSALKAVTEDPIVQAAVTNRAKYDQFNATVAEKKKKGDGSYADVNYQDALDLGGYYSYMRGETKDLGNLNYKDYVDVNGKLNKLAKEYAEFSGKEQLLDTTTGQYYIQDTYGKKVYMSDIYNNLESTLDEKDREQLRINARQSIGKLPEDKKISFLTDATNLEVNQLKTEKAALEAEMSNATNKTPYKSRIADLTKQITDKQTSIENGDFDIYSIYNKSLLTKVADSYDMNIITKIDRDDMPFQILKFEKDEEYRAKKLNLEERKFAFDMSKEAAKQASEKQAANPSIIDKPQTKEDAPSDDKQITDNFSNSRNSLDTFLKATNENGYNDKSPQEKAVYMNSLASSNPTAEGNTVERQNAIKSFMTAKKSYMDYNTKNVSTFQDSAREAFDALKTTANLNNLSKSLPLTASLKKTGKSFSELTDAQKRGITLEMGRGWLEEAESSELDNVSRNALKKVVFLLDEGFKSSKDPNAKKVYSVTQKRAISEKTPLIPKEGNAEYFLSRPREKAPTFAQDSDVTEIDTSEDTSKSWSTIFSAANTGFKNNAKGYKETLMSNKAFNFSTEVKAQAGDAQELRTSILDVEGAAMPSDKNDYTLSKEGNTYKVSYTDKKGVRQNVALNNLSYALRDKMAQTEDKFYSSFKNPSIVLPKYEFKTNDFGTNFDKMSAFTKNRPDLLPRETYMNAVNSNTLIGTPFVSKEELAEGVSKHPNYSKRKSYVDNELNAVYKPNFEVLDGDVLVASVNVKYPDNSARRMTFKSDLKNLDESALYLEFLTWSTNQRLTNIEKILQ
jgi:hypothetical protein